LVAKILTAFTEVKPAEVGTFALLTATVFLILTSYYLLKVVREPLILAGGGAEVKSYASAGQALLLVLVMRGYRALAARFERLALMRTVYATFAVLTAGFGVLALAKVAIGIPFFLYVGVLSLTVIAQFWSFANDVYTPDQGKRLFAIIGLGGSLGAMVGAPLGGFLFRHLGAGGLMLLAAGLLASTLVLVQIVDAREGVASNGTIEADEGAKDANIADDDSPAFDRYLWLVAVLMLLLNWVNTLGEYVLDRTLLQAAKALAEGADTKAFIAEFKGGYFAWVNVVGVIIQLFVASRFLKRFGVRVALFVLPVVALGAYSVALVFPVIAILRVMKIAENSIDYSLQATTNQALYLVTTRKQKYVAKNAIDTFFVRAGDICAALVIGAGTWLGFGTQHFVLAGLALVIAWLGVVALLGREHAKKNEGAAEDTNAAKATA
jgi:AAA family ATP:ADP antiporter